MEDNIRVIETLVMHEASERAQLWEIYNAAFERLNRRTLISPTADLAKASLIPCCLDEDFTKFLVYADGELAGGTLITDVLAKIPWVNVGYFENHYPNRCQSGDIYFLPAVAIDPKHQNLRLIGSKL